MVAILSSMLLAHAQNVPSKTSWVPSSNTSNSTINKASAAAAEKDYPLWDVGIATIFAREVLALRTTRPNALRRTRCSTAFRPSPRRERSARSEPLL